jgi:Fe2+ or Zn2+ uptake regulation protein
MDKLSEILSELKNRGYRHSVVRDFILNSLNQTNNPLSVFDLQKLIKKKKLSTSKVTLYRELNFLRTEKIITDVQLGDKKKYYELSDRKHHHHVVCVKCRKINDFNINENKKLISNVLKQANDFATITNHSFEFFGLCKSCVKK